MSSSEESPAAEADDAAVVKGVLLVWLGHFLADVADDKVIVGTGIQRPNALTWWRELTCGVAVVAVVDGVGVVRRRPPSRHHDGHPVERNTPELSLSFQSN